MRTGIPNEVINRNMKDIAEYISLKNVMEFTFLDTSRGIENEFEAYERIANYFGECECNKEANEKYTQKVADRLMDIYSNLRRKAGLTIDQLLEHPELRTPEMQRCARIHEALTIKSRPDAEE